MVPGPGSSLVMAATTWAASRIPGTTGSPASVRWA